jgi:hypothetical protein
LRRCAVVLVNIDDEGSRFEHRAAGGVPNCVKV